MVPSRLKVGGAFATIAAAGVAAGLALSTQLDLGTHALAQPAGAVPEKAPVVTTPAGPGVSFVKLAREVGPAVVNINVKIARAGRSDFMFDPFGGGMMPPSEGQGTGFIISADGYVLTNDHVVGEASQITVSLADGREYQGKVVGTDPRTDIALVKIDEKKPFPHVRLGDSDKVEIGEWVVAIGNPFGLDHTVTAGIVSAKGRRNVRPSGRRGLYDFIQTDASINPGNSGGPLININGEVIGINSAVNAQGQGIGFAIPINMAKTLVPMLKEHGRVERSYIGIGLQDVDRELAKSFGLGSTDGAIVTRVVAGSPAEKAGLRRGDIITSFDGKPVRGSDDVVWLASTAGIGKSVTLGVKGTGGERKVKVTLAPVPDEQTLARGDRTLPPTGTPAESRLGVEVTRVTDDIARELGLDEAVGIVVTRVERSGAAAGALRRGDVILGVNDRALRDEDEFVKITAGLRSGDTLRLLIVRDRTPMYLAFTV